jgi:hypothetical protein
LLNCFFYELLIVLSVRRDGAAATKVVRPLESRVETAAQVSTGFADFVSSRIKIIAAWNCFPTRCHSVGCGMVSQVQSAMQSDTRSVAAGHTTL